MSRALAKAVSPLRRLSKRRRVSISALALALGLGFLFWLCGVSVRMAVRAVTAGAAASEQAVERLVSPERFAGTHQTFDLCDEIGSLGEKERRVDLPFNGVKRPIIDHDNKLFMCVTPKAGISKMEHVFIEFFKRKHPADPLNPSKIERHNPAYFRSVAANRINFSETFGKGKHSYSPTSFNDPKFLAMNYTKMFVYRNPVDRFMSLWFDKFNETRIKNSWVGTNFHNIEGKFDLDRLLGNLSYWVMHPGTHRDPHIWPQLQYCDHNVSSYAVQDEIDDYQSLVDHLGPLWGVEMSEFGELTRHSTKNIRTEASKQAALRKLWDYRQNFVSIYYSDIEFYCAKRGSLPLGIEG